MTGPLKSIRIIDLCSVVSGPLAATILADQGADVIKIENLDGPIIGVSPDGNMAWVAVKTKFVIAYTDSLGIDKEWEGIEARLEAYEKKENKWEAVACAQTF